MLKDQSGVSLLEILIALLLLAIAVMGFSAMQMRAVKATDETLYRSDALVAVRNISEDMRLYPTPTQRNKYKTAINAAAAAAPANCNQAACTEDQQIAYNAWLSTSLAAGNGIKLRALDCPGTHRNTSLKKMCIVAAWGDTEPLMGNEGNACTDATGVYKRGATCFVAETY